MELLLALFVVGGAYLVHAYYSRRYRTTQAERASASPPPARERRTSTARPEKVRREPRAASATARTLADETSDARSIVPSSDPDPVDVEAEAAPPIVPARFVHSVPDRVPFVSSSVVDTVPGAAVQPSLDRAAETGVVSASPSPPPAASEGREASGRSEIRVASFRTWRLARGRSVVEIASSTRLSALLVSQVDNGTRTPSPQVLALLARELSVAPEQIEIRGRNVSDRSRPEFPGRPGPAGDAAARQASSFGEPTRRVETSTVGVLDVGAPTPETKGSELARMRRDRGLSLDDFSRVSGMPKAAIEEIETGARSVTTNVLTVLARTLRGLPTGVADHAATPGAPARTAADAAKSTIGSSLGRAAWHGPGETVHVAGWTIGGGMLYVGKELPDPRGYRTDPCLIDPSLHVARHGADVSGASVQYSPAYSTMSPEARLAYLRWLSEGRRGPDYGTGYPTLFLYGLERRLLHDGVHVLAPAVARETERLLSIYGRDYMFRRTAARLHDAAVALWPQAPLPEPSLDIRDYEQLSPTVRIHLGRLLASGTPIGPDHALLWVLGSPETRTRTPVERCFGEARALWKAKFDARHPTGLRLATIPKRPFRLTYQSASGSFQEQVEPTMDGKPLPDVASLSAPLNWMRDMLDACSDDLAPYSRLLGRRPDAKGTTEAAMLLPVDLHVGEFGAPLVVVAKKLAELTAGHETALVETRLLLRAIGFEEPRDGKLTTAVCAQVGATLDRLGFGIEPDRRYASDSPKLDGTVALFEALGGAPVDAARDVYQATRVMVEVAALAAASDGRADTVELDSIQRDVAGAPGLEANERVRLRAFACFVVLSRTKRNIVLSRLSDVPPVEKRRVAKAALAAVLADGRAEPSEMRFLEKLYRTLGIPADDLYSAVHRGRIVLDEPAMVAAGEPSAGVALPTEDSPAAAGNPRKLVMDTTRIERIRSETSAVSTLLADIFREEETPLPSAGVARRDDAPPSRTDGLDAPHAELLRSVAGTGPMDRSAFDQLARRLGLLPDGAVETINEWAFDRFDEPAIETDDGVEVPTHLRAVLFDEEESV